MYLAEVDVRRECASLMPCFNGLTRRHIATPTRGRTSVTPVTSKGRARTIAAAWRKHGDAEACAFRDRSRPQWCCPSRGSPAGSWFTAAAGACWNLICRVRTPPLTDRCSSSQSHVGELGRRILKGVCPCQAEHGEARIGLLPVSLVAAAVLSVGTHSAAAATCAPRHLPSHAYTSHHRAWSARDGATLPYGPEYGFLRHVPPNAVSGPGLYIRAGRGHSWRVLRPADERLHKRVSRRPLKNSGR